MKKMRMYLNGYSVSMAIVSIILVVSKTKYCAGYVTKSILSSDKFSRTDVLYHHNDHSILLYHHSDTCMPVTFS